jgi:hypothetical protein
VWFDPRNGDRTGPPAGGASGFDPAIADGTMAARSTDGWVDSVYWVDHFAVSQDRGSGNGFAISHGDGHDSRIFWSHGTLARAYGPTCEPGDYPGFCVPNWETDLGAQIYAGAVVVGDRAVAYLDATGVLHVLDAATGARLWRSEPMLADTFSGITVTVTDTAILGVDPGNGVVAFSPDGCDAMTCEPLWQVPVEGITGLVAGGDVAYATTADGDVVGIATAGCGGPSCAPLVSVHVSDGFIYDPVVDGGQVIVAGGASAIVLGVTG